MVENPGNASPEEIQEVGTAVPATGAVPAPAARPLPPGELAPEPAAGENVPHPGQQAPGAAPASSGKSSRWELVIAISIALVAVTGAVLTYVSIQEDSAAVEADRQSVVETVMVQNQLVSAETQARAFGVLAARYRDLLAEAGALSAAYPGQASLLRQDAATFALNVVTQYMTGTGPTAGYDFSAALQGALTTNQAASIPPDQPGRTAQVADHHRLIAGRIALAVVGLLCVVVLLTLTRLLRVEQLKRGVFGIAIIGYLAAAVVAIAQFA